ncbi:phosphotransferase family protein [Paenibacillus marinisediminis]
MNSISKVIEHFKLNVLHIEGVPESFSSEVYKLTLINQEAVYAKIPYNKDKLIREYQMLNLLQEVIPVPRVLDMWGGDDTTTGAMLLSAIEGVPCSGAVDHKLAYQIGMYHAMLHEVAMPGYGYYTAEGYTLLDPNDWRAYIQDKFETWKEPCKEILDPELYERCVVHFDGVYKALPAPDGPRAVHMDFRLGNILVNDNVVAGIIDYESARGGSTEIDFTKVNRYIWEADPSTRLPYIQGYESIRPMVELEAVLPFYNFYDAFGAVDWCKRRGIEKNQEFLQESVSTLWRAVRPNVIDFRK